MVGQNPERFLQSKVGANGIAKIDHPDTLARWMNSVLDDKISQGNVDVPDTQLCRGDECRQCACQRLHDPVWCYRSGI